MTFVYCLGYFYVLRSEICFSQKIDIYLAEVVPPAGNLKLSWLLAGRDIKCMRANKLTSFQMQGIIALKDVELIKINLKR